MTGSSAAAHAQAETADELLLLVALTAAHVVDGRPRVAVTAPYAKGGPNASRAESVRIFPGYAESRPDRDLAVVILKDKIAESRELPGVYGGKLFPLATELVVIGRVDQGEVSDTKLFSSPVTLEAFPRRLDMYGGFPRRVQPGDSGGPVYVREKQTRVIGLVSRYTFRTRRYVATDGYVPIGEHNRPWIFEQLPR